MNPSDTSSTPPDGSTDPSDIPPIDPSDGSDPSQDPSDKPSWNSESSCSAESDSSQCSVASSGNSSSQSLSSTGSSWSSSSITSSSSSSSNEERCGPDVTDWFIDFTNAAIRSDELKLLQEMILSVGAFQPQITWPPYVYFALLVRPGGKWDMKPYFDSKAITPHCPTAKCAYTVSFSGYCVRSDTLGNIFYGIIGMIEGFPPSDLLLCADIAQLAHTQTHDESQDQESIKIGFCVQQQLSSQYGGITYERLADCLKEGLSKIHSRSDCKLCSHRWHGPGL